MHLKLLIAISLIVPYIAVAQDDLNRSDSKVNIGIGLGMDYGGIGARLTITPVKNFGLFGAFGYALAGNGYNVGLNGIFNRKGKAQGYITGMYGYNGAISVAGGYGTTFKKLYYGVTFGGGLALHTRGGQSYWNFELLVPIRDPAFQDKIDQLKSQGAELNYVPPIGISIGYHAKF